MPADRKLSLEDIASSDLIKRSDPDEVAEMRETLESLTHETLVRENGGDGVAITMTQLAALHAESARAGETAMNPEDAWGYAVSDLVFGAYAVVKGT